MLRRTVVAALLVWTLGASATIAQRIYLNPHPDERFQALFPKAVVITSKGGDPPVFKAYAADPKKDPSATPIGYAFWTPELVPNERGYHGPIHMIVGMDLTGILTGVIVDYNTEPYGYFSVELPEFAAQFAGKSVRDGFRVGADVAEVSRATLTVSSAARAVRDASRIVARAYLDPNAVKR